MRAREFIIEAAYDSMIASMKQKYPDYSRYIDWAKPHLKRQDRIVWYLNILKKYIQDPQVLDFIRQPKLESFQSDLEHYLGQNIPSIQVFQFTPLLEPRELLLSLANLEREWQQKQKQTAPPKIQPGDRQLFEFPDGTAWWMLDRAYCEEEGRSGAHCGNVVGKHKTNQRILSLRDHKGHVILTFILEPDKTLGEMKAKGNNKPQERYHPHIMRLLISNIVEGITGQGFLPDSNFSVFDLDDRYLLKLNQFKPQLITDQLQITPTEILRAPDWLRLNNRYLGVALGKYPQLKSVIDNPSDDAWLAACSNDPELILYAPESLPDYTEMLERFLVRKDYAPLLLKARKKYRRDYEFLTSLLSSAPEYIKAVSVDTPRYVDLATTAIDTDPDMIEAIPHDRWTEDMLIHAVNADAGIIKKNIPPRLRTYNVYKHAVESGEDIFKYVKEDNLTPQQYYELATISAAAENSIPLRYIYNRKENYTPEQLRTLAKLTLSKMGHALEFIPQNEIDYDLAATALENNGHAIRLLLWEGGPDRFTSDIESQESILDKFTPQQQYNLMKTAVETTPASTIHFINEPQFKKLSPEQQHDICLTAVSLWGLGLDRIPEKYQTPDILMAAVKSRGGALNYVNPKDYTFDLVKTAVLNDGLALQYYARYNDNITHKQNLEIYETAVKSRVYNLVYISQFDDLSDKEYFDLCMAAYRAHGNAALSLMKPEIAEKIKSS